MKRDMFVGKREISIRVRSFQGRFSETNFRYNTILSITRTTETGHCSDIQREEPRVQVSTPICSLHGGDNVGPLPKETLEPQSKHLLVY